MEEGGYNRKNPLRGKVFAAETAEGTGLQAVTSCKLVETYIYLGNLLLPSSGWMLTHDKPQGNMDASGHPYSPAAVPPRKEASEAEWCSRSKSYEEMDKSVPYATN